MGGVSDDVLVFLPQLDRGEQAGQLVASRKTWLLQTNNKIQSLNFLTEIKAVDYQIITVHLVQQYSSLISPNEAVAASFRYISH